MSRAEKYTTRKSGASKFLASISGTVATRQYQGSGKSYAANIPLRPPAIQDCYQERGLDLYMKCPARYRYQVIEGLHGGGDESAYVGFHSCVYITVGWLEEERQKGNAIDARGALEHLATVWATSGPNGHPFENYYRGTAESMVRGMVDAVASESARYDRQEWAVPLGARKVVITPDRVLICSNGTVRVQRIRSGRKTKSEPDKAIYALLRRGAALKYPGRPISVEIFYLATREAVPVEAKNDEKLLAEYSDAIEDIERGDFHAEPETRRCPNCPCYFICGV